MRTFLARENPEGLTPQTARGCVGTNLALPGVGSLMAGHAVGFVQAALAIIGFALTLLFGAKFIVWFLANRSTINDPHADPMETLGSMWRAIRWSLLGIGLFAVAWLWALVTNVAILRQARGTDDTTMPPKRR